MRYIAASVVTDRHTHIEQLPYLSHMHQGLIIHNSGDNTTITYTCMHTTHTSIT